MKTLQNVTLDSKCIMVMWFSPTAIYCTLENQKLQRALLFKGLVWGNGIAKGAAKTGSTLSMQVVNSVQNAVNKSTF